MKVLIVDDDQQIRKILDLYLSKVGWTVEMAADAKQAGRLLDDSLDVVLSDVKMGNHGGLDLLRDIRRRFPRLEVILMSGYDGLRETVEAQGGKAFGYLTKPFDIAALNRMLLDAVRAGNANHPGRRESADEPAARQASPDGEHLRRMIVLAESFSSVAHELNQPLNAFSSYLQLMQFRLDSGRAISPAEQAGMCRDMFAEFERMGRIVGRMRDFSRSSRMLAQKEPVEPGRAWLESTSALREKLLEDGIRLEEHFPPGLGAVTADPARIGMIFVNLLLNARESVLKAHPDGSGGLIRAEARPERRDERAGVTIEVRDNGAGIAPEDHEEIFEPFFSTDESGENAGLGLTVLHGIVRNLSGAVEVESTPGAGAAFRVWLPAVETIETSGAAKR